MSRSTKSSVISRLVRDARQGTGLDVEYGVATQVVRNPYLHERRSRAGYVLGALLLLAGVVVAWAVSTRTAVSTAASMPSLATQPALAEPLPSVASPAVLVTPADDDAAYREHGENAAADAATAESSEAPAAEMVGERSESSSPIPRTRSPHRRTRDRSPARRAQLQPGLATTKGVLMIATKPPCHIHVDGKDTGLTTPQRDIKLKRGRHKILLLNREFGVEYRVSVNIRAGAKVRIVRDLTGSMK